MVENQLINSQMSNVIASEFRASVYFAFVSFFRFLTITQVLLLMCLSFLLRLLLLYCPNLSGLLSPALYTERDLCLLGSQGTHLYDNSKAAAEDANSVEQPS